VTNSIRATNIRWRVLFITLLLGYIAYVFRGNLSVIGKYLMDDIGITQIELGWLLSSFLWGYTLFQFPGGLLSEKIGPKSTLVFCTLGCTLITIISGLIVMGGFSVALMIPLLFICRFLLGAFQGPLFPAMAGGVIARWFPSGSWALPNGMTSTALALGSASTPPIIVLLAESFGWQSTFFMISILGLIGSIIWWKYSKNWPREHPDINQKELDLIGESEFNNNEMSWSMVKEVLADKNVLFAALGYMSMNYVFFIFYSWIFIYFVNIRGFSVLEGGFLASLPFLMGAIGATLGGYLCDRLQKSYGVIWGHRIPVIVGLVPSAGFLIFGSITENPYLAVLSLSLCYGFIELTEGPFWSAIGFVSKKPQAAGGILNTGGNLGGVLATPLIPILANQFGWVIALNSGVFFALLGVFSFMQIKFK
jgi:ACS family glucarate transporter-like MFS transporter|tara:strand:+ start:1637 stop:2902 length:1266 start_codon:yes stop_codon:yes gene_type:complete